MPLAARYIFLYILSLGTGFLILCVGYPRALALLATELLFRYGVPDQFYNYLMHVEGLCIEASQLLSAPISVFWSVLVLVLTQAIFLSALAIQSAFSRRSNLFVSYLSGLLCGIILPVALLVTYFVAKTTYEFLVSYADMLSTILTYVFYAWLAFLGVAALFLFPKIVLTFVALVILGYIFKDELQVLWDSCVSAFFYIYAGVESYLGPLLNMVSHSWTYILFALSFLYMLLVDLLIWAFVALLLIFCGKIVIDQFRSCAMLRANSPYFFCAGLGIGIGLALLAVTTDPLLGQARLQASGLLLNLGQSYQTEADLLRSVHDFALRIISNVASVYEWFSEFFVSFEMPKSSLPGGDVVILASVSVLLMISYMRLHISQEMSESRRTPVTFVPFELIKGAAYVVLVLVFIHLQGEETA